MLNHEMLSILCFNMTLNKIMKVAVVYESQSRSLIDRATSKVNKGPSHLQHCQNISLLMIYNVFPLTFRWKKKIQVEAMIKISSCCTNPLALCRTLTKHPPLIRQGIRSEHHNTVAVALVAVPMVLVWRGITPPPHPPWLISQHCYNCFGSSFKLINEIKAQKRSLGEYWRFLERTSERLFLFFSSSSSFLNTHLGISLCSECCR